MTLDEDMTVTLDDVSCLLHFHCWEAIHVHVLSRDDVMVSARRHVWLQIKAHVQVTFGRW